MSLEPCKLCNQDCTPWVHVNGHICQDCANTKSLKEVHLVVVNLPPSLRIGAYSDYDKAQKAKEIFIKETKFGGSDNINVVIFSIPIDFFGFD